MERLPDEVQAKIRDMACVVRSNGVTSSDLELVVRTDALPSSCIKEVEAWILRCLQHSRFDYVVDEIGQRPFHVVANIKKEIEEVKTSEYGTDYPEIVLAVHIGGYMSPYLSAERGEDGLVVTCENPECPHLMMNADDLKEVVQSVPPPAYVTAVGVSGVSEFFMTELWGDIISKDPDTMDVAGKGYMVHPMWQLHHHGWVNLREQSCNFGWKNYVHEKLLHSVEDFSWRAENGY